MPYLRNDHTVWESVGDRDEVDLRSNETRVLVTLAILDSVLVQVLAKSLSTLRARTMMTDEQILFVERSGRHMPLFKSSTEQNLVV